MKMYCEYIFNKVSHSLEQEIFLGGGGGQYFLIIKVFEKVSNKSFFIGNIFLVSSYQTFHSMVSLSLSVCPQEKTYNKN